MSRNCGLRGWTAVDPETVGLNVRRLLALGVIGLNFEDQVVNAPGLYSIEDQVKRLRAVRAAADASGVPAFINARTDVFLKAAPDVDHATLLDEAHARAAGRYPPAQEARTCHSPAKNGKSRKPPARCMPILDAVVPTQ